MSHAPRHPARRRLLAGLGAIAAFGSSRAGASLALAAGTGDRRLVLIVLRGGLDGLHALAPLGDPDYAATRQQLALPASDSSAAAWHRLDALFALPAELATFAQCHAKGELIGLHAIASAYRDRSHFDAQRLLETGGASVDGLRDGWLNRALLAMRPARSSALAITHAVPTVLQGAAPVSSYAPTRLPASGDDFHERIARLYGQDARLAALWQQALSAQGMARASRDAQPGGARDPSPLVESARIAARFLAAPDGARIAVLESEGWDTHVQQTIRLGNLLRQLDAAVQALREGMGEHWSRTAVMVLTEFGRTVRPNGTGGTDHGTGGAAFLIGGAVAGGRIRSDWPGLAPSALLQGRDLMPTLELRALLKAVVHDHLRVSGQALDTVVFPESAHIAPMKDLLRS